MNIRDIVFTGNSGAINMVVINNAEITFSSDKLNPEIVKKVKNALEK